MAADSRPALIAETGISIIAHQGLRALTHRAVDQSAGLPQGSTSYYASTRSALIELIVDALASRTLADARRSLPTQMPSHAPTHSPEVRTPTAATVTDELAALVETLVVRRDDMRARYALLLELDEPSLRRRLTVDSEVHRYARDAAASALTKASLAATDDRVVELLALADALIFQQVTFDDPPSITPILRAYLRGLSTEDQ